MYMGTELYIDEDIHLDPALDMTKRTIESYKAVSEYNKIEPSVHSSTSAQRLQEIANDMYEEGIKNRVNHYEKTKEIFETSQNIRIRRTKHVKAIKPDTILAELSQMEVDSLGNINKEDAKYFSIFFPEIIWATKNKVPIVGIEDKSLRDQCKENSEKLISLLEPRNAAMANNLLKYATENPNAKKLYLVTGADHTDGLLRELDSKIEQYNISIDYTVFKKDGSKQKGKLGK
jgi:hypothetical protein